MTKEHLDPAKSVNQKPPVFNSWRSWYLLVLGALGVLVILFYLLTNSYK